MDCVFTFCVSDYHDDYETTNQPITTLIGKLLPNKHAYTIVWVVNVNGADAFNNIQQLNILFNEKVKRI